MKEVIIQNKTISALKLNANIIEILKNNRINTLMKLSQQTRKDLLKVGLSPAEIKQIQIKFQLQGLDLK